MTDDQVEGYVSRDAIEKEKQFFRVTPVTASLNRLFLLKSAGVSSASHTQRHTVSQ